MGEEKEVLRASVNLQARGVGDINFFRNKNKTVSVEDAKKLYKILDGMEKV